MALSLHAEAGLVGDGLPDGARLADAYHPATVAFRRAGGAGELWERCSIPAGRGLGFSGAVRVAGALLGRCQVAGASVGGGGQIDDVVRADVFAIVSELEGHADNVAASIYGGVVATAAGRVVRVPLGFDPAIVVWIPSFVTKTDESRRVLGADVSFADAVFNVGRVAMLVAALATGDIAALRPACEDRLHQPNRLQAAAPSRAAIEAALAAGAWCAWLSGSGPTVAAMCAVADAPSLAAQLPGDGNVKVLRIDHEGATIT
jgi:homoserine kinase